MFKTQKTPDNKTKVIYHSERLDAICAIKSIMEIDAKLELEQVRAELEDARKEMDAAWALYEKASDPKSPADTALVPLKERWAERYSKHLDEVNALEDVEEFLEKILEEE